VELPRPAPGSRARGSLADTRTAQTAVTESSRRRRRLPALEGRSDMAAPLPGERPLWRKVVSFLVTAAIIVLCAWVGRVIFREWKAGKLGSRLGAAAGKPDDEAVGGLINLRCSSADEALTTYADGSELRCYLPSRHIFLWSAAPKADGTQLLMYYRPAPGSEDSILPWSSSWKGNGVSYRTVALTRLEAAGEKLTVEFKLGDTLPAVTGIGAQAVHRAEFTVDEFLKLVDSCELDVPKGGLSHPDLGWPANLLKRAGALTPAVHEKLRKQ
jgi:hypothetical protein